MKKLLGLLLAASLLLPIMIGCSGSSDNDKPSLYYLREEGDPLVRSLYKMNTDGTGRTKLFDLDETSIAGLDETLQKSPYSIYDKASKTIFSSMNLSTIDGDFDLIAKTDITTGVSTEYWSGEFRSLQRFYIDGDSVKALIKTGVATYVINTFAKSTNLGAPTASLDVDVSGVLSEGEDAEVWGSNFIFDSASGSIYMIMMKTGGADDRWLIVKVNATTGIATLVKDLGLADAIEFSGLYLKGADIYFVASEGTGSLELRKVAVADGADGATLPLDTTDIEHYADNLFTLVQDSHAVSPSKGSLFMIVVAEENGVGTSVDMLVSLETSTGIFKKLDDIDGCFYDITYVP